MNDRWRDSSNAAAAGVAVSLVLIGILSWLVIYWTVRGFIG
jgi:hypothetical protein